MNPTIKALVFDVDGTLSETEELHRKAFNSTFKKMNLPWHWGKDLYGELLKVAGGKERIYFFQNSKIHHSSHITKKKITELHAKKTSLYSKWVSEGKLSLKPGIRIIIEKALKKNIPLVIATSTSEKNVEALINSSFGVPPQDIFFFMSTGDKVKAKKPDPQVYQLALDAISLRGWNCLAFEDSEIGLLSAKKAGLFTLVSPSYYHTKDDFSQADCHCETFQKRQLPKFLVELLFD